MRCPMLYSVTILGNSDPHLLAMTYSYGHETPNTGTGIGSPAANTLALTRSYQHGRARDSQTQMHWN
eukprot:3432440-Rhodomonas_salina.1